LSTVHLCLIVPLLILQNKAMLYKFVNRYLSLVIAKLKIGILVVLETWPSHCVAWFVYNISTGS